MIGQSEKKSKKVGELCKAKENEVGVFKNSAICSVHFSREDFLHLFASLPGQSTPYVPCINRDDSGVMPWEK